MLFVLFHAPRLARLARLAPPDPSGDASLSCFPVGDSRSDGAGLSGGRQISTFSTFSTGRAFQVTHLEVALFPLDHPQVALGITEHRPPSRSGRLPCGPRRGPSVPLGKRTSQPCFSRMASAARAAGLSRKARIGARWLTSPGRIWGCGQDVSSHAGSRVTL